MGCHSLPPGDLPKPGIKPRSPALQADFLPSEPKEALGIAKEAINKVKRQPSEWDKIFANEATEKGSISKIYKQLNITKTTKSKNGPKT